MIEYSCRIYAGLVAAILLVSIASSMPHFASAATSPPVITVPLPITVFPTSSEGALVTYLNVTATGDEPISQVSCNPTSGSLFHIGTTTVNCTATDAAGNIGSGSFTITVMPPSQTSTTLTVNTQDSNGNPINGMRVWLETYSGDVITQAFTPHTFTIKTDTPYKVVLANFGSIIFDHWQDQANNTDRHRIISINSDTTLNGVYSDQDDSHKKGKKDTDKDDDDKEKKCEPGKNDKYEKYEHVCNGDIDITKWRGRDAQ